MNTHKVPLYIFLICQLALLGLSSQPLFAAPIVESRTPLVSNAWSVYAPAHVRTREGRELLAFGGWLTQADEGNDVIYIADAPNGDTAIDVASAPLKRFVKPAASLNDPSLVVHPEHGWLMMYYTNLDEKHAASFEAMTSHNHIGFATSVDDGATWTERTILIGQNNGYNTHGAWAPSALLNPEKNQIWLYYHTNSPSNIVLRTRVALNGWESQGPTEPVVFYERDGQRSPLQNGRLNVDVKWNPDLQRYMMVANEFTLHNVVLYTSIDGIHFYRESDLIQGGPNATYTPEITPLSPSTFDISFGFGTPDNACSQSWNERIPNGTPATCSGSMHRWRFRDTGLLEALPSLAAQPTPVAQPSGIAPLDSPDTAASSSTNNPSGGNQLNVSEPAGTVFPTANVNMIAPASQSAIPTTLPFENTTITPEAPQAPQSQPQTLSMQQSLVFGASQEPVALEVDEAIPAALPAENATVETQCATDAWICDAYQQYLGRMPTPEEVLLQQNLYRTPAELEEFIKSSEEFKAKQAQTY